MGERSRAAELVALGAKANLLIAALPEEVCGHWVSQLQPVDMRLGDVVHEPGAPIVHVYFPTTSVVSLLHILENGASTEVAAVGHEGVVGISAFMGGTSTPNQSVVRSAGEGYRLPGAVLVRALEAGGPAAQLMLLYTQALMTQIAQMAVCNRHHSLEQRLCRLLLVTLDHLHTHDLWMTQDLIGHMLGVRREGVTEAAAGLQKAGVIRYQRGHILVLDRETLARRSCECYSVVRKEFDRLLSGRLTGLRARR